MGERELFGWWQVMWVEPAHLDEVVGGAGLAAHACRPGEAQDDAPVVRLQPVAEKVEQFELEARLLAHLAAQPVHRVLVFVEKTTGQVPQPDARIERAPAGQHTSVRVETDGLGSRDGVRVTDVPAGAALGAAVDLLDSLAADGAEAPVVESSHAGDPMSPRAVGATQHELSRIGLLATLPGETLARLAQRMAREDIAAGAGVFDEGEDGDRFYVVLSGMLTVSQQSIGAQAVLRPGDYFGEVALAMHMPRTASVRALTPATVASCDQQTFDEFIRPLFADDEE